jgi:tetratricopeptide (TPR) repeat protein
MDKKYRLLLLFAFFLFILNCSPQTFWNHPAAGALLSAEELTGDQLYIQAAKLAEQGKYGDALLPLEQATRSKANFAQAYLLMGECYLNLRNFEKAKQNLVMAKIITNEDEVKQKADLLLNKIAAMENGETGIAGENQPETTMETAEDLNGSLQKIGIRGTMTPVGFSVQEVSKGSLAEISGIRTNDCVTKIDKSPVTSLYDAAYGLNHFTLARKAARLEIFSEGAIRESGWPAVVENAAADTELTQTRYYEAEGDRNVSGHNLKEAVADFEKLLLISINYPYRGDAYLKLAKMYVSLTDSLWKRKLPDFPVKKTENKMSFLQAKKIFNDGQQNYQLGLDYFKVTQTCLYDAATEYKRNGVKTAFNDFDAETQIVAKQLDNCRTEYGTARTQELRDFDGKLNKIDFTKWLLCNTAAKWKQSGATEFQPVVDITIQNRSQDTDFEVSGTVQLIDPAGTVRATGTFLASCPKQNTKTVHAAGFALFNQADVWVMAVKGGRRPQLVRVNKRPWSAKIFLEDTACGKVPMN